ncbi:MAG: hypothetical protein EHM64_05835 [Ignavibacteriae bacterium]|nr:MAG: hypothetical protein EHM64_05835 [Ignavibacteriota bacterium]
MGYIFEAEIESIIHAVRIRTIGEDDGIVLKKILFARIHPAIKAYFKAEVEKTLRQERGLEYRSKKFSYALPEVRSLEEQIDLLLVQNYHFSPEEFESQLEESVHFQFNYLCRPQWTLLNFIVGEQRRVSSEHIEKRLRYCVDYTYFPELIKRYIADHGLAEVTYEEFKQLIEKIDQEVVARHSSLELAHMTRALYDFVESGKMVPQVEFEQQTLPINAAIVFFEDKKNQGICNRLEFERDHHRVLQITSDRLADIIEIVRTGNEDATAPLQSPQSETPDAAVHTDEPDVTGQITASGVTDEHEAGAPEDEKSAQSKTTVLVFGENDEQYLASTPSAKQKEILDLFPGEEFELIVRNIFSNDEPAFRGAVTEISLLRTWDQVAQYLDKLFLANQTDPFSAEAVGFTDKLHAHFQSSIAKEQTGKI